MQKEEKIIISKQTNSVVLGRRGWAWWNLNTARSILSRTNRAVKIPVGFCWFPRVALHPRGLHTAYCILHTAYCTLQTTTHYTMYTAHWTLHGAAPHTALLAVLHAAQHSTLHCTSLHWNRLLTIERTVCWVQKAFLCWVKGFGPEVSHN